LGQSASFFGLTVVLPNQYEEAVTGFWVNLLCGPLQHLHHPYYELLAWFMMYSTQLHILSMCTYLPVVTGICHESKFLAGVLTKVHTIAITVVCKECFDICNECRVFIPIRDL